MALTMDFQGKNFKYPHPWNGGLIYLEQKVCESLIHDHDCDLLVTKVRCKDVLNCHQGDFRRRHAAESSIFFLYLVCTEDSESLVLQE